MGLDIKTLSFALFLTYFIQSVAFYIMAASVKKYKGTYCWALGEILMTLGIATMFLRSLGHSEGILIFLTNFFQIGGIFVFFIGSKLFFEFKRKNILLFVYLFLYLLFIACFTFVYPHQVIRIIGFSITASLISINIAWLFLKFKNFSFRSGSIFVALSFILNSLFFIFRTCYYLISDKTLTDFFSPDNIQSMTLLFSISIGLLWTFGIMLIIYHRINGDLAETKNLFELIFNTMPVSVSISDGKGLNMLNTNPGFSRLTGYTKEEAIHGKNFAFQLWKGSDNLLQIKEALDKDGVCHNQEIVIRNKDGEEMLGLLSVAKIKIKDKDCLLTIGRDITEIKKKEQELAQKNQELEVLIAEKDKFFSILAHDLRGPIATTVSLTQLMTDRSYDFSKEELLSFTESLNKSAVSTNELLENLLEWTGLRRGLKAFSPELISFSKLMQPFLPSLMETASSKQILFRNDIPDETLLFADIHMAQTIFRNLIINAIKFTREGGRIQLSYQKDDKGKSIFSISDTGIGMNKETLDNLFCSDFRNNRPGTKGERSSGLGLMLCKEFIEKHGGQIWVKSKEENGSIFSFSLGS